jgi:uncharacterized protein (TIGR02600 family)
MNPPEPWRTLLFCRNPAAGSAHPGFQTIRDHVFLDFFTMPVVEPYAISEPFSTAGKVNLNYEIAPFNYIKRSTALRGVLKSTRVTAIPNRLATTYKTGAGSTVFRQEIDADETLRGFEQRFSAAAPAGLYNGDSGPFRQASEICDMYLVPRGATLANMDTWWRDHSLTGDNARESPYNQIYARVTTKSNTYTIHMRVQALKKTPGSNPAQWNENRDQVVSEFRGSTLIERYVDPSAPNLPDFADTASALLNLDDHYNFRVLETRRFAP